MTIQLQKIGVLSAAHHDCSGSLHTFDECKKYIESTVGIGTHVKPVIFALNLFAVQCMTKDPSTGHGIRGVPSPWGPHSRNNQGRPAQR